MAQIEAIVQPDCIGDDIRRESVMFIGIHMPILALSCQYLGTVTRTALQVEASYTEFAAER